MSIQINGSVVSTSVNNLQQTDFSKVTAHPEFVLEGKKFYDNKGQLREGTLPAETLQPPETGEVKLQEKTVTPRATEQRVTADGYYNGLSAVNVLGEKNLIPENIKENVTIFGVRGTLKGKGSSGGIILLDDTVSYVGAVSELPAPEIGASYTCFVDGEEVDTATVDETGNLHFVKYDEEMVQYDVYVVCDPYLGWFFHPDSATTSGTVSVRINDDANAENYLFKDVALTTNPIEFADSYALNVDGEEMATSNVATFSLRALNLPQGDHTVTVASISENGDVIEESEPVTYTAKEPTTPTLSITDDLLTITGENADYYGIYKDGVKIASVSADTPTYDLKRKDYPVGSYEITADAGAMVNNVWKSSTRSEAVTYTVFAPDAPIITYSVPSGYSGLKSLDIESDAEEFNLYVDGVRRIKGFKVKSLNCVTFIGRTLKLPVGDYVITVRAVRGGTESCDSNAIIYNVELSDEPVPSAPTVTYIGYSAGNDTHEFKIETNERAYSFKYITSGTLDSEGELTATNTTAGDKEYQFNYRANTNGTYYFSFAAANRFGIYGECSEPIECVVDTGTNEQPASPMILLNADDSLTIKSYYGARKAVVYANDTLIYTYTPTDLFTNVTFVNLARYMRNSNLQDGNYTITVKVVDSLGYWSLWSNTVAYTLSEDAGGDTGDGGATVEYEYLFQDEYFDGPRYDLPAPTESVSYALYVDGGSVASAKPYRDNNGNLILQFQWYDEENGGTQFFKCFESGAWGFANGTDGITSGTVSVKIRSLITPTLSIDGDTLNIAGDGADHYSIYIDYVETTTATEATFDLSTLGLKIGEHTIMARAVSVGGVTSDISAPVTYVVTTEIGDDTGDDTGSGDESNEYECPTCGSIYSTAEEAENCCASGGDDTGGDTGGDTGEDDTTTESEWLFEDEYIGATGRDDLPKLEEGVSYTCFVDGKEICTVTSDGLYTDFYTDDMSVWLIYEVTDPGAEEEVVYWQFHPVDSLVTSGTVSVRINSNTGESGGDTGESEWLFENEQITTSSRSDLPLPETGVSYTAFVDGVEFGTATCEVGGELEIYNGNNCLMCVGEWYFDSDDTTTVESGTVSVRINI